MVTLEALLNFVDSPLGLVWTAYVVAVPEGQGLDPTDVVIQEHGPVILTGASPSRLQGVLLSVREVA